MSKKEQMLDKVNDEIDKMILSGKINKKRFNQLSKLGKIMSDDLYKIGHMRWDININK